MMKKLFFLTFPLAFTVIFAQAQNTQTQTKEKDSKDKSKPAIDKTTKSGIIPTVSNDGKKIQYFGRALNTVFNLPVIRYNLTSKGTNGTLEAFNSIGAGFAFSKGIITITSTSKIDSTTFIEDKTITIKDVYGFSLGALYSLSSTTSGSINRLGIIGNAQILDFQIGLGYEVLGNLTTNDRWFVTISYGIPLTKFTNTGSFLLDKIKSETNKTISNQAIF